MKVFREKELHLYYFFLWRFKRVPVCMAGTFVVLLVANCKVYARLRQGSCKVDVIEYFTEQEVLNMGTNYIIETKNLTKQYGSQKSVADLNIHVEKGKIYGLLGRNGAGKTTTMKMLLGLAQPTSGEITIWGKPLKGNEKKILPRIGSLV